MAVTGGTVGVSGIESLEDELQPKMATLINDKPRYFKYITHLQNLFGNTNNKYTNTQKQQLVMTFLLKM